MTAFAVVVTYLPETEECYSTPFSAPRFEDPLGMAHAFRDAEEERGDFPGSLWMVTGNDEAAEIRREALMVGMFGPDATAVEDK